MVDCSTFRDTVDRNRCVALLCSSDNRWSGRAWHSLFKGTMQVYYYGWTRGGIDFVLYWQSMGRCRVSVCKRMVADDGDGDAICGVEDNAS